MAGVSNSKKVSKLLLAQQAVERTKRTLRIDFFAGFTLTDPSCSSAGCPFSGGARVHVLLTPVRFLLLKLRLSSLVEDK